MSKRKFGKWSEEKAVFQSANVMGIVDEKSNEADSWPQLSNKSQNYSSNQSRQKSSQSQGKFAFSSKSEASCPILCQDSSVGAYIAKAKKVQGNLLQYRSHGDDEEVKGNANQLHVVQDENQEDERDRFDPVGIDMSANGNAQPEDDCGQDND